MGPGFHLEDMWKARNDQAMGNLWFRGLGVYSDVPGQASGQKPG